ncbi:MAG: ribose 5-phosphate isomerase B [Candidatus Cloacimonadota bacterium]|nr:MAG: ribose 5-phosphate isomerase B [Candidatus Cloacimonadota bacterium]
MLKTANRVLKTEKTKIALASDHAGFEMKEFMKDYLKDDCEVQDFGAYDTSSMDYPDSGFPAAEAVARGKCELGIIICGSGIGMSIVANKVDGVRAALCHCTDFAKLSRMHNNANVLVLSGRFIAKHLAFEMVDLFLNTPYEGGRHDKRLNKIRDYEERGKYENN